MTTKDGGNRMGCSIWIVTLDHPHAQPAMLAKNWTTAWSNWMPSAHHLLTQQANSMDSLYGCGGSSEYGQKCNGFSVVVSNSSSRLPKSSAIAESSLPHLFWFFFRVWLLLALYSFCVGPAVADVYIQASFLMYVSKSGTLTYIQKVFVQVL